MGLSLRELKEQLMAKSGYTITPNHNHLNDLKVLVDDMMNVRSESPPSTGSGYYSGTNCVGHIVTSDYNLSLGDIDSIDIKSCSCHTVNDTTAYCSSRTYYCSCNSNVPACECNTRTYSCSCNSNIPTCDCDSRTGYVCDCQSRTILCWCVSAEPVCWCNMDSNFQNGDICKCQSRSTCTCDVYATIGGCACMVRTGGSCECVSRTSSCGSRSESDTQCGSRTSDCGSRNTTSCTCNGRCACNSEKRFS